jgi:hypothetical protein
MPDQRAVSWSLLAAIVLLLGACGSPVTVSPGASSTPVPTEAVEEVPEEVQAAFDAALAHLSENYGEQAPAMGLEWVGERTTPQDLVGSESFSYRAGDWLLTISYPVVHPDLIVYAVVVVDEGTGFQWQGEVDAAGQVRETGAPSEGETGEAVEGWAGTIVKLPPGSQFGHYFERDDGQRFDIGSADADISEQIVELRWTGAQVQVWGRLFTGVPAVEARHIEVERLEVLSGPATEPRNLSAFASVKASSELPSDRWGTYHAFSAIDGALETSWVEGVEGPGAGEWIELTFPGTVSVERIGFDVGYDRDEDLFFANNRLRRVTIVFSDGRRIELTFADARGLQVFEIDPQETLSIRVVIEDVYPGSRYDDTCLSEVEVWAVVP